MSANASSSPPGPPPSRRFRKLYCVVFLLACCATLEIGARLFVRDPSLKPEYFRLIEDFPRREAHLRSISQAARLQYYDYHLFAPRPVAAETITFTDYYSARRVPVSDSPGHAEEMVWLFGGSTLQNSDAPDDLTLANVVAAKLKEAGISACVRNFGVSTFQSSMELTKFADLLRRVPPEEQPTLVVFYDGFNDSAHGYRSGAGNFQRDLSQKLEDLVARQPGRLLVYLASESVAKHSVFWERVIAWRINWRLFARPLADSSQPNRKQAVSIYLHNQRMLRAICREYAIHCLFVLQPMIFTKQPLHAQEQEILDNTPGDLAKFTKEFYGTVLQSATNSNDFVDLSTVLNGSADWDFYDVGHVGPNSNQRIGTALAEPVIKALRK
ncbi:MAG: SGNH/GDSL hydrolase family protein [Verrucomicrobiota bacterium]